MNVSIIGTGNMGRGIATRALAGGHTVTLLGTSADKAQAVAGELSGDVRAGAVGDELTGDVVVLAVWYQVLDDVLGRYGDQLAGKVVIDITNPVDPSAFQPLTVEAGSAAQESRPRRRAPRSSRRSTPPSRARSSPARLPGSRWTYSSPQTTRTPRAASASSRSPPACAPSTPGRWRAPMNSKRSATCTWRSSSRSAPASPAPSRFSPSDEGGPRTAVFAAAVRRRSASATSRRERRRRPGAHNRRRLMHQLVARERVDHEQREVDAPGAVAGKHGVADVAAPHRQPLAFAFFEVAAAHHSPAGVAGEDAPRGLDLVVEIAQPAQTEGCAQDRDLGAEHTRVAVLAVAADVPAAGEHQPRAHRRVVEHRLGRTGRVAVHAPRREHHQHAVAAADRAPDDLAVVSGAGIDGDAVAEAVELSDALLAAHADDLVATVERVLRHVLPELAGDADDADLHGCLLGGRHSWTADASDSHRGAGRANTCESSRASVAPTWWTRRAARGPEQTRRPHATA